MFSGLMQRNANSNARHVGLRQALALSLFWRTFFFVAVLLIGSVLTWLQILRTMETTPRMERAAEKVVALAELSRAALSHMTPSERQRFVQSEQNALSDIRILPRNDTQVVGGLPKMPQIALWAEIVQQHLGAETILAGAVDGQEGIWLGFTLHGDAYWVHLQDPLSLVKTDGIVFVWAMTALALALVGAAALAQFIHRPLKELSAAMDNIDRGDFGAAQLCEDQSTHEVQHVYCSFNRMAQRLAQMEADRQLMLAGISHDLRTPLTRLRLEAEISVSDAQTRALMAADIDQLDGIIDKFLEYSRTPSVMVLKRLNLAELLAEECARATRNHAQLRIRTQIKAPLHVLADATELKRVLGNLIENACRYGQTPGTQRTDLDITLTVDVPSTAPAMATLRVRDHGVGVPQQHLHQLTEPFFRVDTARHLGNGVGLGLCIVERIIAHMGGQLHLANAGDGTGFEVCLKLPVDLSNEF